MPDPDIRSAPPSSPIRYARSPQSHLFQPLHSSSPLGGSSPLVLILPLFLSFVFFFHLLRLPVSRMSDRASCLPSSFSPFSFSFSLCLASSVL